MMFWAGFLTAWALWFVAFGLFLWYGFRSAGPPLSREETDRLAAKVREALERRASLHVVKPHGELPSILVSEN